MNGQYGITKNTDSQSDNEVIEMLNWEKLFQKKKIFTINLNFQ